MFLSLTMIITAFTSIYASVLLEPVLHWCDIIMIGSEESQPVKPELNPFERFKRFLEEFSNVYLAPHVQRSHDMDDSIKTSFLKDDFK